MRRFIQEFYLILLLLFFFFGGGGGGNVWTNDGSDRGAYYPKIDGNFFNGSGRGMCPLPHVAHYFAIWGPSRWAVIPLQDGVATGRWNLLCGVYYS